MSGRLIALGTAVLMLLAVLEIAAVIVDDWLSGKRPSHPVLVFATLIVVAGGPILVIAWLLKN